MLFLTDSRSSVILDFKRQHKGIQRRDHIQTCMHRMDMRFRILASQINIGHDFFRACVGPSSVTPLILQPLNGLIKEAR